MHINKAQIIESGKETLRVESKAIADLCDLVDNSFAEAVLSILESDGRLIVTGIGKSAIIGRKMVATFNSTGTPALFMHAADAIHGDLGMIQANDQVLCISKSGNTPEVKALIPFLLNFENQIIALVGNPDSYLAQNAHFLLRCDVEQEADPNNLAPTASSTAQMAMGDALAMALLKCRGFSSNDFATFHPGGSLGKQLYLKAIDLSSKNEKPLVHENDSIRQVIIEISSKRLGATAVSNDQGKITGIITDGDLRRMLESEKDEAKLVAADIQSLNPQTIKHDELAVNALKMMRKNSISQLLVTEAGAYAGIIHLHDLIAEGLI